MTNLNGNTSSGSLRGQVQAASDGDTIVFDVSGAVSINKSLTSVGTFQRTPEGSQLTLNGLTFQISYRGGDGNDVVLTRIA